MLWVYHIWHLLCWGMFLLCLLSEWFFIINGCWILSKAFSVSIEIIIWLLFFNVLMWCITLIDLQILKNLCIPGIKPTWSWCMSFWCVAEFCLLKFYWGFLQLCSLVVLACSFHFCHCCLCLVLVSGWWWPHRMSLEMFLPLQFLEEF